MEAIEREQEALDRELEDMARRTADPNEPPPTDEEIDDLRARMMDVVMRAFATAASMPDEDESGVGLTD